MRGDTAGLEDPSVVDVGEVVAALGTDLEAGLTTAEASRRLAADGPNELTSAAPVPAWRRFLAQLQNPLIYLLLAAIVVSVLAWAVDGGDGWPFDAVVIAAIVLLNAVLGYVQEARAADAVAALRRMSAPTAVVVRDGRRLRVPARDVVVGDLLDLAEGDAVSADARIVRASNLQVLEASLTGESAPVPKDSGTLPRPVALADRTPMVFRGTAVTRGRARAVVTATGMRTEMGRVAGLLHETVQDPTPLQRELARVGRVLGAAVVVIAAVVMGTVLLVSPITGLDDVVTVLLLGVSLAVAAVPEGLPAVLSVVLALGVQRLARHQALVKKLTSVETLGSATVICTDKTGTLTTSEMTVQRVVTASGEADVGGVGYRPEGAVSVDGAPPSGPLLQELTRVLSGGALASDAELRDRDGQWTVLGDPTEGALLAAERKLAAHTARAARFRRVGQVPFTSERKLMTVLAVDAERGGRVTVVTKGAPDVLLDRCTHIQVGAAVEELTEQRRAAVLADVERLSAAAYRTLAVATAELDTDDVPDADESLEQGLVYAGLVGMMDPPRPEAAAAIAEAHRAGVRVVMITGDHPATAARIAADLGIAGPDARVLTGVDLEALDDAALRDAVQHTSVYARVAPVHKLRIVDALQADGHVVAMTGDGVNDAPALKSADIGIAMGVTGTEVTKEAATMILADDDFATIVRAVRQGRAIFDNIRKFLRYLLSSNMGEVLAVFLGVVLAGVIGLTGDGLVLPLLATQILWINLLTDTGPALAMGVDPETDDVMGRPPRRLDERVIDARMWAEVLFVGLVMGLVTLLTIDLYLPGGLVEGTAGLDEARTAGFTTLVLAQLFNCFNARSGITSAFRHVAVNRWLWGAVAVSLVLQVAVVHVPVLNVAFGTTPLRWDQWLVCLAMGSTVLWAVEIGKAVRRVAAIRRAGRALL